jgi:hypothetical protein
MLVCDLLIIVYSVSVMCFKSSPTLMTFLTLLCVLSFRYSPDANHGNVLQEYHLLISAQILSWSLPEAEYIRNENTVTWKRVEISVKWLDFLRFLEMLSPPSSSLFRRFCRIAKNDMVPSCFLSARLSVRMEQLGSHWTDFDEIWYLNFFRKYVEKIHVSLKSDKNTGYFTWRRFYTYDSPSLNSSYNEKYFRRKLSMKLTHTLYMQ